MSFTASATGTNLNAAHFLADDEQCLRETAEISATHLQKVTRNGRTIVPMGAIIPSNGSSAVGILYEDIDVTDGDAPGSIVTKGKVYQDRLPAAAVSDAKTALAGITFVDTSPAVKRPAIFQRFDELSVKSAASSTSAGYTALTVSGHALRAGESYVYKIDSTAAPSAKSGDDLSAWTDWDGDDEISSTTGYKITVAVVNADDDCVAAGSADVTVKAAG